ncbi:MAG: hypothetical protein LBK99_27485 [Opitutaceae bacterium]|jgi:hypothetical protein|nr:hypothetical protein [Opitutaceae bacterium]
MTPSEIARFAQKAAAHRQAAFGQTPIRYRGQPLTVVSTTITREERLVDGGVKMVDTATLRLPACHPILKDNPPRIDEIITYTAPGVDLRIDMANPPGINPEWRLTLISN